MRPLVVFAALSVLPLLARATPHELPFSYPYATLNAGALEIEQYADVSPLRAIATDGSTTTTFQSMLTTEIEYGLTDRLELGLYFQLSNLGADMSKPAGSWPLGFDGIKQRLRLRLAEPGQWPVDVSLYGEISELSDEVELEMKVNLEKRVGPVRFLANLWAERDFYYTGEQSWVLHPTLGASFQLSPAVHIGLEYWTTAEFSSFASENVGFNPAFHHYLGPALSIQGSKLWCSFAPYVRLDNWSRPGQPGDEYGRLWLRMIVGVEL